MESSGKPSDADRLALRWTKRGAEGLGVEGFSLLGLGFGGCVRFRF